MANGLCTYGGENMEMLNRTSKIEKIIDELQDIIESMAYEIAKYKYPNKYSHTEDIEEILKEYEVNKIIKEIKEL